MRNLTPKDANLRAALIIVGGMLVAAKDDKYVQATAPPWLLSALGVSVVGFLLWRAWLDQSATHAANASEPVQAQIVNTENNPVPTKDSDDPDPKTE